MARLLRRRLLELDAWEPVLRAFGATRLDARLAQQRWMAEPLLAAMPAEGYPRVASGTLDARTAWRHVLRQLLGFESDAPGIETLLERALDPALIARWRALPDQQRRALVEWIGEQSGDTAKLVAHAIESDGGRDACALGVVCGALFGAESDSAVSPEAVVRLERFTGGVLASAAAGRQWADAAHAVLMRLATEADGRVAEVLARADELLAGVGAAAAATRSRWLPSGFRLRLDAYGAALREAMESDQPAKALGSASEALRAVLEHERSRLEPERATRLRHALRLARYAVLGRAEQSFPSFADAVRAYEAEHSHADIARTWLASSEPSPALAGALGLVSERVVEVRERFTQQFGRLLQGWFWAPSSQAAIVPVERILAGMVAPLAGTGPVLLVVVDGMNLAVADAIVASILAHGWVSVVPAGPEGGLVGLAALPSITEVCRASLLCGSLRTGVASDERSGFSEHPGLLAHSRPGKEPRLFHRASLGAGHGLSPEVADAIADGDQRVVGVIVNAVDDHLLKDDMVRPQWSLEYVPILAAVVDAARTAGRAIVLTSDHGHILDLGLTERPVEAASHRFRPPSAAARDGEVLVGGPRVVAGTSTIVAAASELIRYGRRKNGYHGGASPQEVVIPLHVLSLEHRIPEGYAERRILRPSWWDLDARIDEGETPVVSRTERVALPLFEQPQPAVPMVASFEEPSWLDAVMTSEALAAQRRKALRTDIGDTRLRAVLAAVAGRGGRITVLALAERLGVPSARVPSVVAAAAQLTNFDGYQCLFMDADDVVLDVPVLRGQFLGQA
jgi:hypothetical protein